VSTAGRTSITWERRNGEETESEGCWSWGRERVRGLDSLDNAQGTNGEVVTLFLENMFISPSRKLMASLPHFSPLLSFYFPFFCFPFPL
jgi:hypothetical protein